MERFQPFPQDIYNSTSAKVAEYRSTSIAIRVDFEDVTNECGVHIVYPGMRERHMLTTPDRALRLVELAMAKYPPWLPAILTDY